jgi:hypothetical protein
MNATRLLLVAAVFAILVIPGAYAYSVTGAQIEGAGYGMGEMSYSYQGWGDDFGGEQGDFGMPEAYTPRFREPTGGGLEWLDMAFEDAKAEIGTIEDSDARAVLNIMATNDQYIMASTLTLIQNLALRIDALEMRLDQCGC